MLLLSGKTQQASTTLLTTSSQSSSTSQTSSGSQTTQQSTSAPSGYVFIAQLGALSGKSFAYFTHPTAGSAIFVNASGQWKAFSAVCTHRPCTVNFSGSSIYCPCHGGSFSTANGTVTGGPPPSPLPEYGVQIVNGNVYVSNSRIN